MIRPRVIVCLDVKDGRVVKGRKFQGLRDVGDPVEMARAYEEQGADEIVFLDVSATLEGRRTLINTVRNTAEVLFVPLTVGGGIGSVRAMAELLRAGADKVSVNSAAVKDPDLLARGAREFGRQCVVASIDAARSGPSDGPGTLVWRVHTHGGSRPTPLDALEWAEACVQEGAGEILLTSIDSDGVREGYDLELTRSVVERVSVPVIASGGAGRAEHLRDGLSEGGASAVLLAGILHDGLTTVMDLKKSLREWGVAVR
jgi:cyclase